MSPTITIDGVVYQVSSFPLALRQLVDVLGTWQNELSQTQVTQNMQQTAVSALQSQIIGQVRDWSTSQKPADNPPPSIPEAVLNLISKTAPTDAEVAAFQKNQAINSEQSDASNG